MSELLALQRDMMQWLQTESGNIQSQVLGTKKVSMAVRLAIYTNAYRYRLIDALSDNYPSVHTLLGDEGFYESGIKYISEHPSQHFSIRYFGSHLEAFLAQHHPESTVLAEMARFEWALRDAFDAEDVTSLGINALQTIAPESWASLGFALHPSVARVDLQWNVPQLWSAIEEETGEIPIEEADYPVPWLIWRKDLKTYYRSVDVDEAWALDNVMQGASFADICAGVCEWIDEEHAPARVAGFISEWLAADMIVELKISSF